MADLLRGWPGSVQSRPATHVNPIPARKASRRAKYGGVGADELAERKLARIPAPTVVRPRKLRTSEFFNDIIRRAEQQPQPQQQQVQQPQPQQQPQPKPQKLPKPLQDPQLTRATTSLAAHPHPQPPLTETAAAAFNATATAPRAAAAVPPGITVAPDPAGFHRRVKLFADNPDAPHPRTTARIVARIAACRHWRRPLASRLLPKFLPLFDEHAAAYFFRHVPSLQPRPPPDSRQHQANQPNQQQRQTAWAHPGDVAGFRLMVLAVCCSLLHKVPSFGPRALACMAGGLGRMQIWHAPSVAAWDARSASVLALMRTDQLVVALEGRAALSEAVEAAAEAEVAAGAAAELAGDGGAADGVEGRSRAGVPNSVWRAAAVAAVDCALPGMSVGEVGRLLRALHRLRLQLPPALLHAACDRVRAAVEGAAAVAAAQPGGSGGGSGGDGRAGASASALRILAMAEADAAGATCAAGADGAAGASPATRTAPTPPRTPSGSSLGARSATPQQQQQQQERLPDAVRGRDVSRFVSALGVVGHAPSADWLSWLLEGSGAVLATQLQGSRQKQAAVAAAATARGRRTLRRARSAAHRQQGLRWEKEDTAAAAEAAATPWGATVAVAAPPPYFPLEALAELVEGVAGMRLSSPGLSAQAPSAPQSLQHALGVSTGGGRVADGSCGGPSNDVHEEWLNLVCEAALEDMRQRLAPEAAAAVAAAAAAAAPTAVLTRGDVTRAEDAAVAAAVLATAAGVQAAANLAPAASGLLAALLRLSPLGYSPPLGWWPAVASAEVGLALAPYMPPTALLTWLNALGAWRGPTAAGPKASASAWGWAASPSGLPSATSQAWAAAVAVVSRSQLADFRSRQLCELPAAVAAAGLRLPAGWAAHYLRHLAARLPPPPPSTRSVGLRRRKDVRWQYQRQQQGGPPSSSLSSSLAPVTASAALASSARWAPTAAAARIPPVALSDVAAALGQLPAAVADLRLASRVEEPALQALVAAFGAAQAAIVVADTAGGEEEQAGLDLEPSVAGATAGRNGDGGEGEVLAAGGGGIANLALLVSGGEGGEGGARGPRGMLRGWRSSQQKQEQATRGMRWGEEAQMAVGGYGEVELSREALQTAPYFFRAAGLGS